MIKRLYNKLDGGHMFATGFLMAILFIIIYTFTDLSQYSKVLQIMPLVMVGIGLLFIGAGLNKIHHNK